MKSYDDIATEAKVWRQIGRVSVRTDLRSVVVVVVTLGICTGIPSLYPDGLATVKTPILPARSRSPRTLNKSEVF